MGGVGGSGSISSPVCLVGSSFCSTLILLYTLSLQEDCRTAYAKEDSLAKAAAHERSRLADAAELAAQLRSALDATSLQAESAVAERDRLTAERDSAQRAAAAAQAAFAAAQLRLGAADADVQAARGAQVREIESFCVYGVCAYPS